MTLPVVGFSSPFDAPFLTGLATSVDVPGPYHVAIDGHPYLVDLEHSSVETTSAWYREESLPLLRTQADSSDEPAEHSISPEQTWRRSQESWHRGAGQQFLDRDNSDRARFRTSKGVNPWTQWELSLLNSTSRTETFAGGSGSSLVSTGGRAYASSGGTTLRTSDDLSSWSTVTGTPGGGVNCLSLATDGRIVYQAWSGASGIYSTDSVSSPTTAASLATGTATLLGYVKGRLLVANGAALSNYVSGGAIPAAFWTHSNANWTWTGFAEGDNFIYAAGSIGNFSAVYKIGIKPDGTVLTEGSYAGGVPLGETITAIHGYLGFILLGTSKGVRFCTVKDSGDLTIGGLIETPAAVRCFTSFEKFTWFGWTTFDATSGGLGRLNLQEITDGLVPAYASDLMATSTGVVNAVATVDGKRVFAIDADGVYVEQATPVANGTLVTGRLSYGIVDPKVLLFVDIRHKALPVGTEIQVLLAADDTSPELIGVSTTDGTIGNGAPFSAQQQRAELAELTFSLFSSGGASPTLRRWTMRAIPAPVRTLQWTVPLRFEEVLSLEYDIDVVFDVGTETLFIRDLHESQRVVSFQFGNSTFQVILSDYQFLPYRQSDDLSWTGTMTVQLREIGS